MQTALLHAQHFSLQPLPLTAYATLSELPMKERRGKFGGPKKKATFIAHEAVEFLIAQGVCHDEASGALWCICSMHSSVERPPCAWRRAVRQHEAAASEWAVNYDVFCTNSFNANPDLHPHALCVLAGNRHSGWLLAARLWAHSKPVTSETRWTF